MNLRPTKRRIQEKLDTSIKLIPKEIWLIIFNYLKPKKSDYSFRIKQSINDIYNCRIVCKKWSEITKDAQLWNTIINNFGNWQRLWEDITYYRDTYYRSKYIEPHSYFAQITMRNFKKEDATLSLLAKWFRRKRWRLLFQTLSPILTLSTIYFDKIFNNNPNSNFNDYYLNFERDINQLLFIYGPNIHDTHHYISKMQNFWSNNECGVKQYYGNCFYIQYKNNRTVSEPSHLVFHDDERGLYLEIRRWMKGSGLNCYSSDRVDPKHIWFGILCMQELWRGNQILSHYDESLQEWRKCINIWPKMS